MLTDATDNILRLRRHFEAPPPAVFAVFTRPELVSVWFASSHGFRAHDCDIDLRPGGRWRLRNTKGDVEERVSGTYHEVNPDKRLCYSYHFEGTDFFSIISIELKPVAAGTELIFCQSGFPDANAWREHSRGWSFVLTLLEDALLASRGVGAVWVNPSVGRPLDGVARDLEEARARAEATLQKTAATPTAH